MNEITYISRLSKCKLFALRMNEHALDLETEDFFVVSSVRGLGSLLRDPKLYKNAELPNEKELDSVFEEIYKKNLAEVKNYKKWIYGYAFLMMWSIFEDFLDEIFAEIIDQNPQLCTWQSRDQIIAEYSAKKFDKKIKNIFIEKLKISENDMFDFSFFKEDVQHRLSGQNLNSLIKLNRSRHNVAHSDGFSIDNVSKFELYHELLEKLIFSISRNAHYRWNTHSDMIKSIKKRV